MDEEIILIIVLALAAQFFGVKYFNKRDELRDREWTHKIEKWQMGGPSPFGRSKRIKKKRRKKK